MSDDVEPDAFNLSLRKFLRQVGVTSQRAIETAADQARASGNARTLTVRAIITAEGTDLHHVVEGELDLS